MPCPGFPPLVFLKGRVRVGWQCLFPLLASPFRNQGEELEQYTNSPASICDLQSEDA